MRAGIRGPILALPGHREAAPHAEAAAGVRHRRGVAAVRQEMRVRARGVRRPEAARREHRRRGQRRRAFGGPRLGDDGFARHALLQQQLGRLHPRIRVEPAHEHVVAHDVGQRDQRHALVMAEEGPDQSRAAWPSGAASRPRAPACGRCSRSTRRSRTALPPPARARRSRLLAAAPGSTRLASAVAYGATTRSSSSPRLRPEARHAERLVLIGAGAIRDTVYADSEIAPRDVAAPAVFDLPARARAAALIEQRARESCASAAAASGTRTSCRPTTSASRGRRCSSRAGRGGTSGAAARRPWRSRRSSRAAPPRPADRRTSRRRGPGRRHRRGGSRS